MSEPMEAKALSGELYRYSFKEDQLDPVIYSNYCVVLEKKSIWLLEVDNDIFALFSQEAAA